MEILRKTSLVILLATALAMAASTSPAQEAFVLESPYLQTPVGDSTHFLLTGTLGGNGFFKPQATCSGWTLFGDPTICLPIFIEPTPVEYIQLKIADPLGKGRTVYQIIGDLKPQGYTYTLVVPKEPASCAWDLTIRKPDGQFDQPLHLRPHPIPTAKLLDAANKPELGVASYMAYQVNTQVTVFGYGVHPTTGYRQFFRLGPEDIFPPILEFYVVPPSVGAPARVPFVARYSFHSASQTITKVQVRDKNGMHKVPVIQLPGSPQSLGDPTLGKSSASQQADLEVVPRIVRVRYAVEKSLPPNLVVTATGQVPTLGWTKPRLVRAVYTKPPADGIWDYYLLAAPPTGPVPQLISTLEATNRWKDFDTTIKGIRVHGIGAGIRVILFANETATGDSN